MRVLLTLLATLSNRFFLSFDVSGHAISSPNPSEPAYLEPNSILSTINIYIYIVIYIVHHYIDVVTTT